MGVGAIAAVLVIAGLWIGRGGAPQGEPAPSQTPVSARQQGAMTRLAILPFTDNSPQPQEWLASGLADALSTRLGRINPSALGVLGPQTTTYYAQPGKSLQDLREDLNVAFVLRGSIQNIGNDVRITANLIEADDLTSVWSTEFKGTLDDPFALQSIVAEKIIADLPFELTGDERVRLQNRYAPKPEAELAYMRGRYFGMDVIGGEKNLLRAVSYFEQAIEIDPEYPLPYCGLAAGSARSFALVPASGRAGEDCHDAAFHGAVGVGQRQPSRRRGRRRLASPSQRGSDGSARLRSQPETREPR